MIFPQQNVYLKLLLLLFLLLPMLQYIFVHGGVEGHY
jgi:hypothetical protein